MPELTAAEAFADHWAACDWCQEGLPCPEGDPLWAAIDKKPPPMPEIIIPAIDWHIALADAISGAEPGAIIIVCSESMLGLAERSAQRMGKTGITFEIAEARDA